MLEFHSKSTPPVTGHSLPVKIIHSIFDTSDYCSFLCADLQLFPLVILRPLDPHRIHLLPLPGIEISRQGSYTSSPILPLKQHPSFLCQGFRALPSLLPCQWTSANWSSAGPRAVGRTWGWLQPAQNSNFNSQNQRSLKIIPGSSAPPPYR